MTRKVFTTELLDWQIVFLKLETKDDLSELMEWLQLFQVQFQSNILDNFDSIKNSGLTFKDEANQTILIIIFPCTSVEEYISTVAHEKRHAEDFILQSVGVEDLETAGYLAGFIAKNIMI